MMLSIAGIVNLILFGIIVLKQPQYVHDLKYQENNHLYEGCFYGAATYAGTFVLCYGLLTFYRPKEQDENGFKEMK